MRTSTLSWNSGWLGGVGQQLTVDSLDASAVVVWELEVFSVKPLVEGGHDGRGVVGVLQAQSVTQLMDGHQKNIITPLVHVPSSPRLSQVEVCVSTDAVSREVSVSQKAALSVKWCAVAVETLREGEHDVCKLVDPVPDVAVGNLPEGEGDHALPHLEGFTDGLVCGSLADLRGIVLYAVNKMKTLVTALNYMCVTIIMAPELVYIPLFVASYVVVDVISCFILKVFNLFCLVVSDAASSLLVFGV